MKAFILKLSVRRPMDKHDWLLIIKEIITLRPIVNGNYVKLNDGKIFTSINYGIILLADEK